MPYLFLGIALLVGLLLAARWFANADPKVLVQVAKWVGVPLLGGLIVFLAVTGRLAAALMLVPVAVPWIMRLRSAATNAKNQARMSANQSNGGASGQSSEVETRILRMSLDHDSGEMTGVVKEGPFAGRELATMPLPELVDLLNYCLMNDPQSAKVLEAYLDRTHEDWRLYVRPAGAGGQGSAGGWRSGRSESPQSAMTRDECYKILGLEPGASAQEIKAAYHRLMSVLHPDKGGSTYLAAKLNEAKDLLLQGH